MTARVTRTGPLALLAAVALIVGGCKEKTPEVKGGEGAPLKALPTPGTTGGGDGKPAPAPGTGQPKGQPGAGTSVQ